MSVTPHDQGVLRALLESTAATTGEEYFRSLVRHLAEALNVRYAFLTRRSEPGSTRLRTLAFWRGDGFGENFEYDATNTACEPVLNSNVTTVPHGLRERFPHVEAIRKWGAESYLGIPVTGAGGEVIGHLAALDTRPLPEDLGPSWILEVFAARAGAEIERYEVEQELERSESRYRALVEQIPVVTYIARLDDQSSATYVSPQIEAMTGFTPEEWCGSPSRWRRQLHPEDRDAVLARLEPCLERSRAFLCDYRLLTKDGRVIWIREHGIPLTHGPGQADQFQGVMADVSAQKRLEQEMVRGQKVDALSVLAGGVAHEFNNLLTTVLANSSLALERLPGESPARARVTQIKKAALRAAELTQAMLAFSGKGHFVVQPLNLNDLLREMAPLLRTFVAPGAELELNLDENAPAIEADAGQLRQAVVNLVGNASDALESCRGFVRVSTGVLNASEGCLEGFEVDGRPPAGECSYLDVSDTGAGMDEATKLKAFDPFFSTKFPGRGLGLAAVQGIVRGHGGAIRLDSRPGRGTTVRLLFPSAHRPAETTTPEEVSRPVGAPEGKVLVVDDDEGVQAVARSMLEGAGVDVLTAGDGIEGIDLFKRHAGEISVVLVDLTMPKLGGDEVLEELRRIDPEARVILMSGYNEQRVKRQLGADGPAGFLQKPFKSDELIRKLQQALETRDTAPDEPSGEA